MVGGGGGGRCKFLDYILGLYDDDIFVLFDFSGEIRRLFVWGTPDIPGDDRAPYVSCI